ncbi:MAG: translocation/assembly module TamB domain-containing protein [bacterium]
MRFIAILLFVPLLSYPKGISGWIEKKADEFIKKKIARYSKEVKIKKTKYIFPNKFSLSGISYYNPAFSIKGDGLLEVGIEGSVKVILFQPYFSIKRDFFKKKRKISLPNIEIKVIGGGGEIAGFGMFNDVSGSLKNRRFRFNGCGLGGKASIDGTSDSFTAYIKDAKASLLPYLPQVPKKGNVDITIKKEAYLKIIGELKDCSIKNAKNIKGNLEWKNGITTGRLSFLWDNLFFKANFKEKNGFYNITGNTSYKKNIFPFSIDGVLKDDVFKIKEGYINNTRFSGDIGEDISLYLKFDNANCLALIHPIFKGVILNGCGTITGNLEKPNIFGCLTLKRDNETLDISINGDNNILFLNTGTISLSGSNIASSSNGTISLKPMLLSLNFIKPVLFEDGNIEWDGKAFVASLVSEKRRLFLKKEGEKPTMFRYADLVKQIPLDLSGKIVFEKEKQKIIIEYGKFGEIPINQGLCNIKLENGIFIENLELLVDGITSIYSQFKVEEDKIDAPILITNIKTERFLKNLKAKVDFKGRLIGSLKKPSIFGQIYSTWPKIIADIMIIEDTLAIKNARVNNTEFELEVFLPSKTLSGFAGFNNEDISKISNIFLLPPHISGIANGSATFSGFLYNPEITGNIKVLNPTFFQGINSDSFSLCFKIKDKALSSKGYVGIDNRFLSFDTSISSNGEIESKGNASSFKIAELPINGSFSFNGLYRDKTMDGTLSTRNIVISGYRIPDITEAMQYQELEGLNLSGMVSGSIKKGVCNLVVSFDNLQIGPAKVTGKITAKGEVRDLEISGEISIAGSNLSFPIFQEPFDDVSCRLAIDDEDIRVMSFTGKTKKTKISLQQIKDNTFEVKTNGEPIKIDIPGIIKGEALAELIIENIEGGLVSRGKIIVSNARFTYPPEKQGLGTGFLDQFIYGPQIEAGHNVWFYNEFCNVEIEKGGWLKLIKEKDIIKPSGSCHSKRGMVEYLSSNFSIGSADFEFRDGIPYLTGYADTTIDSIPLRLSHQGMISLPIELSLSSPSFPEKNQDELIKIIQGKKERPSGIIASLVGKRIAKGLVSSVRSLTRLDLEVITPFPENIFQGTQTYSYGLIGTEVKIGRYLTKRIYLIYEGKIEDYESEKYRYKHRIGFEYDIGKRTRIKYLYTPESEKRNSEYEIGIRKAISF